MGFRPSFRITEAASHRSTWKKFLSPSSRPKATWEPALGSGSPGSLSKRAEVRFPSPVARKRETAAQPSRSLSPLLLLSHTFLTRQMRKHSKDSTMFGRALGSIHVADELSRGEVEAQWDKPDSEEPQRSRPRILVVDDERLIADTIADILEG